MKTNIRKILKFTTLLITSLLIATASASYYRYLYISGSVSVSTGGLVWVKGAGATGSVHQVSINGYTASVTLNLNNGTESTIDRHLYLKNLDSDKDYSVTIEVTDPASSNLCSTFTITIRDNTTDSEVGSLNALQSSSSITRTITRGQVWHIVFYVITKPDASGSDTFNVRFMYS
jgi:hypothetical protein